MFKNFFINYQTQVGINHNSPIQKTLPIKRCGNISFDVTIIFIWTRLFVPCLYDLGNLHPPKMFPQIGPIRVGASIVNANTRQQKSKNLSGKERQDTDIWNFYSSSHLPSTLLSCTSTERRRGQWGRKWKWINGGMRWTPPPMLASLPSTHTTTRFGLSVSKFKIQSSRILAFQFWTQFGVLGTNWRWWFTGERGPWFWKRRFAINTAY